jgi:hypothetical protein
LRLACAYQSAMANDPGVARGQDPVTALELAAKLSAELIDDVIRNPRFAEREHILEELGTHAVRLIDAALRTRSDDYLPLSYLNETLMRDL